MIQGRSKPRGKLSSEIIPAPRVRGPGLAWHLRTKLRWTYIHGWIGHNLAPLFSKMFGILTVTTKLSVRRILADGTIIDCGVTHYGKVITDDGAEFIVDAWQNSVELENMVYHGIGTSATAVGVTDAALNAEITTQYSPDSTRATGTAVEASAQVLRSVGTNTLDGAAVIEEFGLFSQAATGGGIMFEHALTGTQTLGSGDGLQTTYEVTFNSGG
jgi:hypothetical protein